MRSLLALLLAVSTQSFVAAAADLVANRTLRAGTVIAPGDIAVHGQGLKGEENAYVGLEVRRAVYAGHRILETDLGPPTLVRRNDVVTMIYRAGTLGLRTEGRALGSGGTGERVEVMNLDSRLTVRATVVGPRRVEVRR